MKILALIYSCFFAAAAFAGTTTVVNDSGMVADGAPFDRSVNLNLDS